MTQRRPPLDETTFLESIVENLPDMVFVKDAEELRFVRFNTAGEQLLGLERDELLGKNDHDLFPSEEADFFTAKDREVLRAGVLIDIPEEPIHTPTGVRWLHTKKIPILDEAGAPRFLLGISEDITDRRLAEGSLRLLLEQLPGALWLTDEAGVVRSVEGSAAVALGLAPGTRLSEALGPPLDDERLERVVDGASWSGVVSVAGRAFEVRLEPLDHDRSGVHGVALDVTDRRRLEVARERARIVEHLPHPILVWRARDGRFVQVTRNRAAGPEGRFAGIPGLHDDLERCLRTDSLVAREVDCDLPDLGRRHLAVSYAPMPPDNVILHIQDMTDLRRTEEQLRAAQRLETVARLAGGVAHDFNNLLTVVLAHAELALDRLGPEDPLRHDLLRIQEAGDRAADVTRQLLAFSRRQVLAPRRTDLRQVVRGIEAMLDRLLGEDVEVSIAAADDVPDVLADPSQLEQVVMNLAVNARDAMPRGGRLSLTVDRVGDHARLSVTDTGTGMDAATLDRVLEPFFTTKEPGKGTGLGLSIVHGIVEQSGGHLQITSEVGRGTTVEVTLPPASADAAPEPPAPSHGPAPGTETILVVEDDAAVREVAERLLRLAGYEVVLASTGDEALAQVHRVDLVITDVVMPGMSGRELAVRLRALRPTLPVLFTSGYAGDLADVDAADFLPKPYTLADLTRKVRAALDG